MAEDSADLGVELARLAPNLRARGYASRSFRGEKGSRGWTIHATCRGSGENSRQTCQTCQSRGVGRATTDGSDGPDRAIGGGRGGGGGGAGRRGGS